MSATHWRGGMIPLVLAFLSFAASPPVVPLVEVVKNLDREAVRALLQRSVDVNARAADGSTALHWAVHGDSLDLVDQLLRAGARVKVENRYGVQPLALAVINGNAAIIEHLLRAGGR